MKISSKAWHVQFTQAVYKDYKPRDLCSHFWRTFWPLFGIIALFSVVISWLGWLGWDLISNILNEGWGGYGAWVALGLGIGTVLITVPTVLETKWKVFSRWSESMEDSARRKRREKYLRELNEPEKVKKVKKPSLFRLWFRARKKNLCPMIELVDE